MGGLGHSGFKLGGVTRHAVQLLFEASLCGRLRLLQRVPYGAEVSPGTSLSTTFSFRG